jgi:nucleotide-binding universal stress UspA family protein
MKKWLDNNDDLDEQEDMGWELEVREPLIYRHILVVIEDMPAMYATIQHAIRLAAATDATLYFLALPLIPTAAGMPDMMSITNELLRGLTHQSKLLLEWAADTAACAGITCRTYLRWRRTSAVILQVANDIPCDLIVMSAPSSSGWKRFLRPCMAKRVAAQADQPVLMIKAPRHPAPVS